MVKHIVSFRLSGTKEERRCAAEKFKTALMALPSQIDVLENMEVGINENPAEDWDVVLTATVPTSGSCGRSSHNRAPEGRPCLCGL